MDITSQRFVEAAVKNLDLALDKHGVLSAEEREILEKAQALLKGVVS